MSKHYSWNRYLGAGLIVGAAATVAYVASRHFSDSVPSLVDWHRVRKTARKHCHMEVGQVEAGQQASAEDQYARRVRLSEDLIARYIGRELPQKLTNVHVLGRAEWIDANIVNFQQLFAPFEQMNSDTLHGTSAGQRLFGGFNQFFLSTQLGVLLGFLAQRVLGQYDLALLGHEPLSSGRLYFVEPNIAQLERRLKLDPEEFRLWIALHETTHAYEFEANPWLRGHMNSLIQGYFESISNDFISLRADRGMIAGVLRRVAGNILSSQYMVEWFMTEGQRQVFRRTQALMCLLEGFSNHVMQAVGAKLLPTYDAMKARFEERAKDKPPIERVVMKLIGMDMKMEQYELGERFVGQVVEARGIDFINRVWDAPENLPTLEEVKAPRRWIERLSRTAPSLSS